MKYSLGFSPCPNDTFMFAALVNHWIDTAGIEWEIHMEDIETLNAHAAEGKLDITKMSFHRWLDLQEHYPLLTSGAALGRGCGPLWISQENMSAATALTQPVALPGYWTTAHLLLKWYAGTKIPDQVLTEGQKQFMPFHQIEKAVLSGETTSGVIIHENRFTYEAKGLIKIVDLGEAWEEHTGLPIPLGGICAKSNLDPAIRDTVQSLIRKSIEFAWSHPEKVMDYVRQYSQEMSEEVMKQHIELYVNEFSLDLGAEGRAAVDFLKKSYVASGPGTPLIA